ncbi:hypothetical protein GVAV_001000 [Gurleya vavrai]
MTQISKVRVEIRIKPTEDDILDLFLPHRVTLAQKSFTFDYVHDSQTTHEQIFKRSIASLIDSFFNSFNCTVFAYGQTGSGKTYTMGISIEALDIFESNDIIFSGVVPDSLKYIFNNKKEEDKFFCSLIEVYNEEVIDLLSDYRTVLSLRQVNGETNISGSKEILIENLNDAVNVLKKGLLERTVKSTKMNIFSSRSHAIYTIILHKKTDEKTRVSKFTFVDLAGSERMKRTEAQGTTAKESISINGGLLALSNVITALSKKSKFIPYRDSKLTRILQHGLGGNSETLMLANISGSAKDTNETFNTLKYANRATNICNDIKKGIEIDIGRMGVIDLKKEILRLKGENNELKKVIKGKSKNTEEERNLELFNENNKLREEIRKSRENFKNLINENNIIKNDKKNVENNFEKMKTEYNNICQEFNKLKNVENNFEKMKTEYNNICQEFNKLKIENNQKNIELQEIFKKNNHINEQIKNYIEINQQINFENNNLKSTNMNLNNSIQNFKNENLNLRYEIDKIKDENLKLKDEIHKFKEKPFKTICNDESFSQKNNSFNADSQFNLNDKNKNFSFKTLISPSKNDNEKKILDIEKLKIDENHLEIENDCYTQNKENLLEEKKESNFLDKKIMNQSSIILNKKILVEGDHEEDIFLDKKNIDQSFTTQDENSSIIREFSLDKRIKIMPITPIKKYSKRIFSPKTNLTRKKRLVSFDLEKNEYRIEKNNNFIPHKIIFGNGALENKNVQILSDNSIEDIKKNNINNLEILSDNSIEDIKKNNIKNLEILSKNSVVDIKKNNFNNLEILSDNSIEDIKKNNFHNLKILSDNSIEDIKKNNFNNLKIVKNICLEEPFILSVLKNQNSIFASTLNGKIFQIENEKQEIIINEDEEIKFMFNYDNSLYYTYKNTIKKYSNSIADIFLSIDCNISYIYLKNEILIIGANNGILFFYNLISNNFYFQEKIFNSQIQAIENIKINNNEILYICSKDLRIVYIDRNNIFNIEDVLCSPIEFFISFNELLICCCKDGCLKIYKDNKLLNLIENAHSGIIKCGVRVKNGIFTGGKDGVLKQWKIDSENNFTEIGCLNLDGCINSMFYCENTSLLYVACMSRNIYVIKPRFDN